MFVGSLQVNAFWTSYRHRVMTYRVLNWDSWVKRSLQEGLCLMSIYPFIVLCRYSMSNVRPRVLIVCLCVPFSGPFGKFMGFNCITFITAFYRRVQDGFGPRVIRWVPLPNVTICGRPTSFPSSLVRAPLLSEVGVMSYLYWNINLDRRGEFVLRGYVILHYGCVLLGPVVRWDYGVVILVSPFLHGGITVTHGGITVTHGGIMVSVLGPT